VHALWESRHSTNERFAGIGCAYDRGSSNDERTNAIVLKFDHQLILVVTERDIGKVDALKDGRVRVGALERVTKPTTMTI
jgi:hypothetical protein